MNEVSPGLQRQLWQRRVSHGARAALLAGALLLAGGAPNVPHWEADDIAALTRLVAEAADEGLDPHDYNQHVLNSALRSGLPDFVDAVATGSALHLLADFRAGAVRGAPRKLWHMPSPNVSAAVLRPMLARALADHQLTRTAKALLPQAPDYQALRAALRREGDSDSEAANRIRVNMERWRWMPRDLGRKYILVNVAAGTISLANSSQVDTRSASIFMPRRPVPQTASVAKAVVLNPGTACAGAPDRQRPQIPPTLALAMSDDTGLCLGLADAGSLATSLLDRGWSSAAVMRILQSKHTQVIPMWRPTPVYLTYFTAVPVRGRVEFFPDVYRRDPAVERALLLENSHLSAAALKTRHRLG